MNEIAKIGLITKPTKMTMTMAFEKAYAHSSSLFTLATPSCPFQTPTAKTITLGKTLE
jgi:hypothetical protein